MKGSFVYIENRSNETVLSISEDEKVISQKLKRFAQLDAFTPNDTGQMWLKRESNEDGYFILTNPHTQKILTAGSDHHFEIIGTLMIDMNMWYLLAFFDILLICYVTRPKGK